MSRYSIDQFVESTRQRDHGEGFFELESERMLEIKLQDDWAWMKYGAMIAYSGAMKFEREGILEKGLGKSLKKALTGEGARLSRASGSGRVYVADSGKKISILALEDEAIVVNGSDILAFEQSIDWDIKMMKRVTAIAAGGLFNVRLQGTGLIAISTHFDPMTLVVEPGHPVVTDPNATVAWSGSLTPELKTDLQFKSFLGRGSGESFQMRFEGAGFVVVQPYEELALQTASSG
ncbi:MAG: AIM24 family protein [Planctomycetota bacterium]